MHDDEQVYMNAPPRYLSLDRVAALLGVPLAYLKRLANEKAVPVLQTGRRTLANPAAVKGSLDALAAAAVTSSRTPQGSGGGEVHL